MVSVCMQGRRSFGTHGRHGERLHARQEELRHAHLEAEARGELELAALQVLNGHAPELKLLGEAGEGRCRGQLGQQQRAQQLEGRSL